MKLDKRIKALSDILTCFDVERAKEFLGEKGYFAGDLCCFKDLQQLCAYGILVNVFDDRDDTFQKGETIYPFFIPKCLLKPKEKQYRPYKDTKEFFIKTNFAEGDLIHIRFKNKIEYWLMLVGWTDNRIKLGTDDFTFENLFENFELWDGEENFIPFGVEE